MAASHVNCHEDPRTFRYYHKRFMESMNAGKINLPFEVISDASTEKNNLEILSNVVAYLIRKRMVQFPNTPDFTSTKTIQNLIENQSNAKFVEAPEGFKENISEHVIGNMNMHTFDENKEHLVLMYAYDDYERLDVITDFFTGNIRNACHVRGKLAPEEVFVRAAQKIATAAVDFCIRHTANLNSKALYDSLYIIKVKQCTNFRVSVAMALYEYFNAHVIYDPCAGWGDRVIAAALSHCVTTYVGTDTNAKLKSGYEQIREFFKTHRPETKILLHHTPAEDFCFSEKEAPDLIFTSPPFFDCDIPFFCTFGKKNSAAFGVSSNRCHKTSDPASDKSIPTHLVKCAKLP